MELGEKLRQARLAAGLSQRQLCGQEITRNMLSQIENGAASPSMKTLRYLADTLGKSISYFLEEEPAPSPNQGIMASARRLYDSGEDAQAALVLEAYQSPDPVFDREKDLLWCLLHLRMAEKALAEGKIPYAKTLLEKVNPEAVYCSHALHREKLLLEGACGASISARLPSLDPELRLRAAEALAAGAHRRAAALLEAAQCQDAEDWLLLRGRTYFEAEQFQQAAQCFHQIEDIRAPAVLPLLEACYRELGDYRHAYLYACRQR